MKEYHYITSSQDLFFEIGGSLKGEVDPLRGIDPIQKIILPKKA